MAEGIEKRLWSMENVVALIECAVGERQRRNARRLILMAGSPLSIELHIFLSDASAPTGRDWQHAIEAAGFPLILHAESDLALYRGFVPATYKGRQTGFEFYLDAASDILAAYPHVGQQAGRRTRCATLRWSGDLLEMCAALAAAVSLAKLTDGLYFSPEDGTVSEPDEALAAARNELKSADL